MNTQNIISYIQNLDNENIELKKKIENNETINNELQESLNNFTKVSIINNLNKQLQDKNNQIIMLEKQISKLNIHNEELKRKNDELIQKNETISSINDNLSSPTKESSSPTKELINDNSQNKNVSNKKKSKKKYQQVKYKKNVYLLDDETNELYDIIDDKPNKIIGNYINNKIILLV
jgi:hypothetical protein